MQWLPIVLYKHHSEPSNEARSLVTCWRMLTAIFVPLAPDAVGGQQRLHRPRLRLKKRIFLLVVSWLKRPAQIC